MYCILFPFRMYCVNHDDFRFCFSSKNKRGSRGEEKAIMPGYTGEDNSAMSSSVTENPTQDTVTSTDETVAIPKHIGPRSQSSKKFKIESVSVSDDPLYNPNASSPYLSRRRLSKDAVSKLSSNEDKTKGAPSQRAEPEVCRQYYSLKYQCDVGVYMEH